MMIFVREENGKISSVESFKFSDCIEIEVDDDFNVMDIFNYKYEDGKLVELTPEEKEEFYTTQKDEKAEQEATLEQMMFASAKASFLIELPDNEAAKIPLCYDPWKSFIGKPLTKLNEQGKENRIEYQGELWKVRQDIPVVLENQPPSIETASLYERIDVEHEGTIDDPIPYDQTMTVYKDKYYTQNDVLYLCLEDSGQPLYADCENLPRYFQKVEE